MSPARTVDGTLAPLCDRVAQVKKSKEYAYVWRSADGAQVGQKYGVVLLSRRRVANQHHDCLPECRVILTVIHCDVIKFLPPPPHGISAMCCEGEECVQLFPLCQNIPFLVHRYLLDHLLFSSSLTHVGRVKNSRYNRLELNLPILFIHRKRNERHP